MKSGWNKILSCEELFGVMGCLKIMNNIEDPLILPDYGTLHYAWCDKNLDGFYFLPTSKKE